MRASKLTALIILAGLVAGWATGAFQETLSDEDRIRAALKQVASGAEQAQVETAIEPFSTHYEDARGLDRKGMYGLLWSQFKKRGPISVWMSAIDVEVDGARATASFDAALLEGSQGGSFGIPVSGDALTFEVAFALEDDSWRITGHTRRPAWVLPDQQ